MSDFINVTTWQGWQYVVLVLDAQVQALYDRQPESLIQAGIEPLVGSKCDSYDNAWAVTIDGLYKVESIHRCAPRKSQEAMALPTLR